MPSLATDARGVQSPSAAPSPTGWRGGHPLEGARRVSCFVGVGDEPDTGPLIAALRDRGIEVLLPITLADFSLDWAVYTGDDDLVDASYGLREPAGPRLGVAALAEVDVVLVPALSVDPEGPSARAGRRLLRPSPAARAGGDAGLGGRSSTTIGSPSRFPRSRTTDGSTASSPEVAASA